MSGFSRDVAAWLATHHGVITHQHLHAFGVSRRQIQTLLAHGVLARHVDGVFHLTGAPPSPDQAAALACMAAPGIMVSHQTAGRMWGLRALGPDRRLHVTLPGRVNRSVPGAVVHRSHRIDPVDVVERTDGIRITSPPRTAFDLAWWVGDEQLESIFEQLLHDRVCTVPTLFATGRRLAERGRNGSARYIRVLQSRPAWLKPVDSDLELRFERAIVRAGLPRPLRQHPIALPDGETIHPDFYWPDARRVAEIDHITWHGGKLDTTADTRRDRKLDRIGIRTSRVTDHAIRHQLRDVVEDFRALLNPAFSRVVSTS